MRLVGLYGVIVLSRGGLRANHGTNHVEGRQPKITGKFVISTRFRPAGWLATAAMGIAAVAVFWFVFL